MVSRGRRKTLDASHGDRYRRMGSALIESARVLHDLADEEDRFGNAIGIVVVHAVIAYADALSIAYGGFKSTEGDHAKAVDALQDAMGHQADPAKVRLLRSVISRKDEISYSGTFYRMERARKVFEEAVSFAEWAEDMYVRRTR